jgi:peptidoglycan/LPS O-acetylase OafA/YrhL
MHIKQLDGLRAIAVTCVVLSHTLFYPVFTFFKLGNIGVDIFFTLSGFLITGILLSEKEKLEAGRYKSGKQLLMYFYARRFLRIFPLYYLVLIICLFINYEPIKDSILWLATYTSNWKIAFGDEYFFQQYTHFWSLAVEEQFYVFFPLIILAAKGKKGVKTVLLLMIATGIGTRIVFCFTTPAIKVPATYYSTFSCLDTLCLGGLLALLKDDIAIWVNKQNKATRLIALVLAVLLFVIANSFLKESLFSLITGRFFTALLTCMIIFSIIHHSLPSFANKLLCLKPVVYIGKISYCIYIIHPLLAKWFADSIEQNLPRFMPPFATLILIIFLLSALSRELFEKRILALKKNFYIK